MDSIWWSERERERERESYGYTTRMVICYGYTTRMVISRRAPTDQARNFCIVTREHSLLLSAEHGDFSFPGLTCHLETVSLPPALLTKTPNRTTRVHQLSCWSYCIMLYIQSFYHYTSYQQPHSGIFPLEGRLCNFGGTHKIHKHFLTESTGSTWVGKEQRIKVETVHTRLFWWTLIIWK
jgi:hypothetical protein